MDLKQTRSNKSQFLFYPTPVKDQIQFSLSEGFRYKVNKGYKHPKRLPIIEYSEEYTKNFIAFEKLMQIGGTKFTCLLLPVIKSKEECNLEHLDKEDEPEKTVLKGIKKSHL